MKNSTNLKGANALNKTEQQSINGGKGSKPFCDIDLYCSYLRNGNPNACSNAGDFEPDCCPL